MLRVNLTEEALVPSKILAIFSDKTFNSLYGINP